MTLHAGPFGTEISPSIRWANLDTLRQAVAADVRVQDAERRRLRAASVASAMAGALFFLSVRAGEA